MKKSTLKKPSDYPQLNFRVSVEDKIEILSLVERIISYYDERHTQGKTKILKNDILVKALKAGLKAIDRNCQRDTSST